MGKTIDTRIGDLESRKPRPIVAVWYEDQPTVTLMDDTHEVMTVDEFKAKYPDGVLLHVIYEDQIPSD